MNICMDRTELEIAGIRYPRLIKYYFLPQGVRGLILMHGRSGVINLCEKDRFFDFLESRAAEIYEKSEDKSIAADERTKSILENRISGELPSGLALFSDLTGSACFDTIEKNRVSALRDMLCFVLSQMYESFGSEVSFREGILGYKNRYALECILDGERRLLPFTFTENPKGFYFSLGNIFEPRHSADIALSYDHSSIYLTADIHCTGETRIERVFDLSAADSRVTVIEKGAVVSMISKKTQQSELSSELAKLTEFVCGVNTEKLSCFKLPWGGFGMISEDCNDVIISEKYGGSELIRCSHRERMEKEELFADSFAAVHEICDGKVISHFIPSGVYSRGTYKERFENKYFCRKIKGDN